MSLNLVFEHYYSMGRSTVEAEGMLLDYLKTFEVGSYTAIAILGLDTI